MSRSTFVHMTKERSVTTAKRYAGFNLAAPSSWWISLRRCWVRPVDATGKPSASKQALRAYAADHEVVQIYLEWKKCEKRRQMTESLLKFLTPEGRVHASYWQLGAETGRMSCSDPNLQQVPRDDSFRSCVKAPEGWVLVDADYQEWCGLLLQLQAMLK